MRGLERRKGSGHTGFLLPGTSPVFRSMFFGPMKETGEMVEVKDTTSEALQTMIDYIYKPPGSCFFPANYQDAEDDYLDCEDYDEDYMNYHKNHELGLNRNVIQCPQKFFDLLDLAEKYEIFSLKMALTSSVFKTLPITDDKVATVATVAMKYKIPFEEISTKMLARCLKFLLQKTKSKAAGDLWTQFWALVNNSEESLKKKLAGTPFVSIRDDLRNEFLKASLDKVGRNSYDICLYLACSGVHVR